ncbi:MAG: heterodisulfide reductase subunit C [Gemmatimonadales bacterium]|nr:heterodisulfide reductase subunit C [Gemmatimonadales bacterium]NIN12253.1 heterodisulfide reductase subunit C [Gemmatimonadales bacterium]NIN50655.1 heterodisulfide reductase subunit C [Gemmatimonadales bacterium]NIP08119.1 heterodisulfide reductase subunit C [Gemmatimonadales bacterium]NIR03412.1 heterodisulfide reductase subunit C [Gemmatimonadales bacterium]
MTKGNTRDPPSFPAEVMNAVLGGDALRRCFQCGACGGSCPSAADMNHSPSRLFAMIRAGLRNEVLRSNTPWYCVACYYCAVRCPQEIPITDLMYGLKRLSIQQGLCEEVDAADFSRTFIGSVERYGRSFELGLATRYHLTHRPLGLPKLAPTGLGMLLKGRMALRPHRIKDIKGLRAILSRARVLERVR